MRVPTIGVALAAALLLSACAGAIDGNPQGYAGINHGQVEFFESGGPKQITVYGGKESGTVRLSGVLPDGTTFEYEAFDNLAFKGQDIRGAVERAISQDVKDAFPGVVDSVVNAIKGTP
jgi:hypothetical protein